VGEHVRRQHGLGARVDPPLTVGTLVEDLVGEREGRGLDLGDPGLDGDRIEPEAERSQVAHLVPDDDHALGQLSGVGRRAMGAQHVDAGLLEVVHVDDVVDVSQQVEVGPAQGTPIGVPHPPDAARRDHVTGRSVRG